MSNHSKGDFTPEQLQEALIQNQKLEDLVQQAAHSTVPYTWMEGVNRVRLINFAAQFAAMVLSEQDNEYNRKTNDLIARHTEQIEELRKQAGDLNDEVNILRNQKARLLEFIKTAQVSSGVCCCGDSMDKHAEPMNCGHTPVDMWDNSVIRLIEEMGG